MPISQKTISKNQLEQKIEEYTSMDWFGNVGTKEEVNKELLDQFLQQLNIQGYHINWVTKEECLDVYQQLTFRDSNIWLALSDFPDKWKREIEAINRLKELEMVVERLPEAVFQYAFDRAYNQFNEEKIIHYFTGVAMYLSLMSAISELADGGALYYPIRQIMENGHIPFGIEGNTIYLI